MGDLAMPGECVAYAKKGDQRMNESRRYWFSQSLI